MLVVDVLDYFHMGQQLMSWSKKFYNTLNSIEIWLQTIEINYVCRRHANK